MRGLVEFRGRIAKVLPGRDGRKRAPLAVAPDGEFVPARVREVKAPAARERERLPYDAATRAFDLSLDRGQVGRVQHHERAARGDPPFVAKPAAQPTVMEARVIRTIVLELPAERRPVESFRGGDVGRRELDIIDATVLRGLRHGGAPVGDEEG